MNLYAEWAKLNASCFQGELWPCEIVVGPNIEWTTSVWGACYSLPFRRCAIWIWDECPADIVIDTLAHEMIHQWQRQIGGDMHHDRAFRRRASLIHDITGLSP